jgi:hypothetical protein
MQLIDVKPYPLLNGKTERRILCPECKGSRLPLDAITECDNCGAHLEIYVKTHTPSTNND